MKRTILVMTLVGLLFAACEGPKQENDKKQELTLEESIKKQEAKVYDPKQEQVTRQDATVLINLYEEYARKNPTDSLAAEYLFRASDISMNLGRPGQTLRLFDKILNEYPDFEKVPTVMFLKAFVYEDKLQEYDSARRYYELFLEKYPDSDFADDAEVSLQNLGKTPEELIKEFEALQQEN